MVKISVCITDFVWKNTGLFPSSEEISPVKLLFVFFESEYRQIL
jgi:hypothetical protein